MNFFSMYSSVWRGINKLIMMLYAGFLWCICSLPVVTMGASSAALFEVMLKMTRDQEGYIGSSFLKAFVSNLKQGILAWLPLLLAQMVFAVNLFYYGVLGGGSFKLQAIVFGFLLLCSIAVSIYTFPIMAKFENSVKGTLLMAIIMAFRKPGWTLALVGMHLIALFCCWFFVYLPVLFIMGIVGYGQAIIFNHIFGRAIENGEIIEAVLDANA